MQLRELLFPCKAQLKTAGFKLIKNIYVCLQFYLSVLAAQ